MIAKAEWFNRRKYTGWGVMPRTWQGVVYVMVVAGVIAFIQSLPLANNLKMVFTGVWTALVVADVLRLMASIKLDEREQKIEAIAERNASWTFVVSIALAILYITTVGKDLKGIELLPVLIFPIVTGVIVKGITNYILDRKGI